MYAQGLGVGERAIQSADRSPGATPRGIERCGQAEKGGSGVLMLFFGILTNGGQLRIFFYGTKFMQCRPRIKFAEYQITSCSTVKQRVMRGIHSIQRESRLTSLKGENA